MVKKPTPKSSTAERTTKKASAKKAAGKQAPSRRASAAPASRRAPAPAPPPREPRRSTLQQERSRQSRQALLDAAYGLWTERGFDDVKVEEVCDAAGVSKGLFYFYFATKEDLLVDLTMHRGDEAARTMAEATEAGEPIDEVVRRGLAVMVRLAQRTPRHLLVRSITEWLGALERHGALRDGYLLVDEALTVAIQQAQRDGDLDTDHPAGELGASLSWLLLQAQLEWASSASRQPALLRRLWSRAEVVLAGAGWQGTPT